MEAAKTKRTTAKSQFTRYEKRLKDAVVSEEIDEWTVNRRYEDLKDRWDKTQDAHDEYTSFLTEPDDFTKAEEWLDELSNRFDAVELRVGKKLKELKPAPTASASDRKSYVSEDERKSESKKSIIPMKKMQFKIFAGDIRKFPLFKSEFIAHVVPHYSNSQLAFILKEHLSESIQDEVSNVIDNYNLLWERLDQKYGNIGHLVDKILDDIKRLEIHDASSEAVLNMISIVEKANSDLERLGQEAELHNSTTISIIEQSMTKEMKFEWVKEIAGKPCTSKAFSSRQKFTGLMEFLKGWRNRLEYMGASIREDVDVKTGGSFHVQDRVGPESRKPAPKIRCWLHNNLDGEQGDHPIWRCKSFLSKPTQERCDLATVHKACHRCLIVGCAGVSNVKNCSRSFRCYVSGCDGDHSPLLHVDKGKVLHANEASDSGTASPLLPLQNL